MLQQNVKKQLMLIVLGIATDVVCNRRYDCTCPIPGCKMQGGASIFILSISLPLRGQENDRRCSFPKCAQAVHRRLDGCRCAKMHVLKPQRPIQPPRIWIRMGQQCSEVERRVAELCRHFWIGPVLEERLCSSSAAVDRGAVKGRKAKRR
eukprot:TRINITY_DN12327_c1_g3_i1.p3 TRINITY_DN12327_c1_g3~~TRINITY_DN12327_c1_g3_i1.p3  ORF type:complete len:150 (-),score=6.98 TRINITY_DN12327_c1_g3_i1:71-520(-)